MQSPTRRTMMKCSLMPVAGLLGFPSISEALQNADTSYRRPKLKITEIRTAEVRVHGYQVHVRVYTDQGIIGQGESTDAAQGNVPLIRSFARLLVGQDPLNVEAAFERIRTSGIFAGAQAGPIRHRVDRRGDRAVGHRRQGHGPAGLSVAGRKSARPRPHLLRFRRERNDSGQQGLPGAHERNSGNGIHRGQDRYRRRHRPLAFRPRQLDRQQQRDRPHAGQNRVHARELSQEYRSGRGYARRATTPPPASA